MMWAEFVPEGGIIGDLNLMPAIYKERAVVGSPPQSAFNRVPHPLG